MGVIDAREASFSRRSRSRFDPLRAYAMSKIVRNICFARLSSRNRDDVLHSGIHRIVAISKANARVNSRPRFQAMIMNYWLVVGATLDLRRETRINAELPLVSR